MFKNKSNNLTMDTGIKNKHKRILQLHLKKSHIYTIDNKGVINQ